MESNCLHSGEDHLIYPACISSHLIDILAYIRSKYGDVINSTEVANADALLQEAQGMIDEMRAGGMALDDQAAKANETHANATEVLEEVTAWQNRSSDLIDRYVSVLPHGPSRARIHENVSFFCKFTIVDANIRRLRGPKRCRRLTRCARYKNEGLS